MRIKLDESVPSLIANPLREAGHDVHTTPEEGLAGRADPEIWEAAQRESRFLTTQDPAFGDPRSFGAGKHHGVLLLRLRRPSWRKLLERAEELLRDEPAWQGLVVVATEARVRILRPTVTQ